MLQQFRVFYRTGTTYWHYGWTFHHTSQAEAERTVEDTRRRHDRGTEREYRIEPVLPADFDADRGV